VRHQRGAWLEEVWPFGLDGDGRGQTRGKQTRLFNYDHSGQRGEGVKRYRLGAFREVVGHLWEVEDDDDIVVVGSALLWAVTVQLSAVVVGKKQRGLEKRTGFLRRDHRVCST